MNHHEAIESLANSLDPSVWVVFKEPVLPTRDCGIPDVLAIRKSYANFEVRVYEVKVSDSDFKQDFNHKKYEKYFGISHRVYFAFGPKVSKTCDDMLKDEKVGLTRFTTTWRTRKHAPRISNEDTILSWADYLALLMNGKTDPNRRITRLEAAKAKLLKQDLKELQYSAPKQIAKIAKEAADNLRKLENVKSYTKEDARKELLNEMGIWGKPDDLHLDLIERAVRKAAQEFQSSVTKDVSERLRILRNETNQAV